MPGKSTGRKSRNFGAQVGSAGARSVAEAKDIGVQVGTYPDLSQKAKVTMQKCSKQAFPKFRKCNKEVFLFMRGKRDVTQTLKNAFVRDRKVVENFGGTLIGIAEQVTRCECDLYRGIKDQCVVVIMFKDMDHAERWTQSSRAFKQRDFPSPADEMEIFAVPVSYLPDDELRCFQLTEMFGFCVRPDEFQSSYVNQVSKLMNSQKIYHGVIATPSINRLRNCMIRPDTFVLLNCADSEDKLREFYDSNNYQDLKEFRHKTVAENDSCIFTLMPLTS